MTFEESLQAHLVAHITLVTGRVFADVMPQGATLPCLIWTKISHTPDHTHDGYNGFYAVRIQVSIWSTRKSSIQAIYSELETHLAGYAGILGGAGGVVCGSSILVNAPNLVDLESGWLHTPVDFIMKIQG